MKRLLVLVVSATFILAASTVAQPNIVDVVYLKNGTIIQGVIFVHIIGESIQIQSVDGNRYDFTMDDISRISREPLAQLYEIPRREPVLGCLLSGLVPGAGQFYNEDYGLGATFFAANVVGWVVLFSAYEKPLYGDWYVPSRNEPRALMGLAIIFGSTFMSMFDAVFVADEMNKTARLRQVSLSPITSPQKLGALVSLRF